MAYKLLKAVVVGALTAEVKVRIFYYKVEASEASCVRCECRRVSVSLCVCSNSYPVILAKWQNVTQSLVKNDVLVLANMKQMKKLGLIVIIMDVFHVGNTTEDWLLWSNSLPNLLLNNETMKQITETMFWLCRACFWFKWHCVIHSPWQPNEV